MGNDLAPGRGREGEDRGLNKQAEVGGWYRPSSSPDIQPLTAGRPPARAPGGSAATAHRPAPHRPPRSSFPPTPPPAGPRLPSRPRPGPRASPEGLPPRGARRPRVSRAGGPSPEPGLPPSTGTFPKRAEAAQSPRAPLLQPVRAREAGCGMRAPRGRPRPRLRAPAPARRPPLCPRAAQPASRFSHRVCWLPLGPLLSRRGDVRRGLRRGLRLAGGGPCVLGWDWEPCPTGHPKTCATPVRSRRPRSFSGTPGQLGDDR